MEQLVDINCDVGEGLDNEAKLMPYISSCNIACGGHAGTVETIRNTIKLALKHTVKIGAHPSFPDKENFGRVNMRMGAPQLQQSIEAQIRLLKSHVASLGARLHHVKPHGALYNLAATDKRMALVVIEAVKNTAKEALLYVPYQSLIAVLAEKNGLKIKIEAFADRNYNSDLTLVSRKDKNAVITDPQKVVDHLVSMILQNKVVTVDGGVAEITAETFCVHGDNPKSEEVLNYISKELPKHDIKIA